MINRQRTIEVYGYDPDGPEARGYMRVVWNYDCCGFELHAERRKAGKSQQCRKCTILKRSQEAKERKATLAAKKTTPIENRPLLVEKIIHGQSIMVKVYRTGVLADFSPKVLDRISDKGYVC